MNTHSELGNQMSSMIPDQNAEKNDDSLDKEHQNLEVRNQMSSMIPDQNAEKNDSLDKEHQNLEVRESLLEENCRSQPGDTIFVNASPNIGCKTEPYNRCSGYKKWVATHISPEAMCHTTSLPITLLSVFTLILLLWGTAYTLFEENVAPNSNLFILISLFILAFIAGRLISFLKLPPLLGMLLVGIIIGNLNIFIMEGGYKIAVSTLRSTAMVVILIKAGLGLDAEALRRLSFVVIRLAFIPCLIEATVVTVASHYFLNLPWLWGALLGFVLGAVSPAVVVPSLLALKEQGYGEDKGISTLVIAASSIDDILAISGFGVVLSTIFSQGAVVQQILQGPLEVCIGLSFGFVWGIVSIYIPHRNENWVVAGRSLMVGFGGLFAVFGSQMVGYSGAGPLASIIMAFVACYGWKKQGYSATKNPVEDVFSLTWQVFQPVLFGLIGTAINLSSLESHAVMYGIATLIVGLAIRLMASFLVAGGGTLNLKERFFVAISWFPKATVQAAIGPVALDLAEKWGSDEEVKGYGSLVLTIAVLSIILTAPLGAVGIYIAGPRLLGKVEPTSQVSPNPENDEDPV